MPSKKSRPKGRRSFLAALGLAAAAIVLAGIYVTLQPQGNGEALACSATPGTLNRLAGLATGEVAALNVHKEAKAAGPVSFIDAGGKTRSLSEWKGRTVLVNLWATWCAPCKFEMPALDELQGALGGDKFEVVAINLDVGGPDKGKAFYDETGISNLAYFHDPDGKVFRQVNAVGMPTTILLDEAGCEIARLAGPAEWAGADAQALLKAAIRP